MHSTVRDSFFLVKCQSFCSMEFGSEKAITISKIFSEPNWNRFGKSYKNSIPKMPNRTGIGSEKVIKILRIFSEPNWNRFGNGHWIKCSCTASKYAKEKYSVFKGTPSKYTMCDAHCVLLCKFFKGTHFFIHNAYYNALRCTPWCRDAHHLRAPTYSGKTK